ncbi:MAG: hypothetical protein H0W83_07130 [Planctomycetes bacterium]|nr:hypothetical protein [Planctomycetota bacterium]
MKVRDDQAGHRQQSHGAPERHRGERIEHPDIAMVRRMKYTANQTVRKVAATNAFPCMK